jgi:hypothetical protein
MRSVVRRLVVLIGLLVITFSLAGPAMARGFVPLAMSDPVDIENPARWISDLSLSQQINLIILMHDVLSLPHP